MKARMGRRKDIGFSNLELIQELRERGLAVTAYDYRDLEEVGVKPSDCEKRFKRIREDLEDQMAFAANKWLDERFLTDPGIAGRIVNGDRKEKE